MRPFVLLAALFAASASPAPAQVYGEPTPGFGPMSLREADLFSRQQAAEQRAVALENQLNALEARVRTDENLRQLESQQARHAPPGMDPASGRAPRVGAYASIPNDRLAASNARVRAASNNRR
jgi:hypothetical protein